jgi:hypothetical protein
LCPLVRTLALDHLLSPSPLHVILFLQLRFFCLFQTLTLNLSTRARAQRVRVCRIEGANERAQARHGALSQRFELPRIGRCQSWVAANSARIKHSLNVHERCGRSHPAQACAQLRADKHSVDVAKPRSCILNGCTELARPGRGHTLGLQARRSFHDGSPLFGRTPLGLPTARARPAASDAPWTQRFFPLHLPIYLHPPQSMHVRCPDLPSAWRIPVWCAPGAAPAAARPLDRDLRVGL